MGVVYRLDPHGRLSVVYSFSGLHDGANPSTIMQHTDGKLYGFTGDGGSYSEGTFFSIDLGLRPFVSLVSMFGKPGDTIGILGQVSTERLPWRSTVSQPRSRSFPIPT